MAMLSSPSTSIKIQRIGSASAEFSPAATFAGVSTFVNNPDRYENNAIAAEKIGELIESLSAVGGCIKQENRAEFLEKIKSTLIFLKGKSMLSSIVRKHGWTGTSFRKELDCYQFYNDLSYAYMICNYTGPTHGFEESSFSPVGAHGMESQTADNLAIQSFCPDLVFSMAMVPDMLSSAVSAKFWGCCLLVDISGFTKLSSSFCEKGNNGLDDLHSATSDFLGFFSDTVYKYGGDVIAFAGDALICVFRSRDAVKFGERATSCKFNELMEDKEAQRNAEACLSGVMCAFELKNQSTDKLTCHVGASCGEMSIGILGGHKDKWTYLLNGGCIPQLSSCIDDAGSKELVITSLLFETIEPLLDMDNTAIEHSMKSNNRKVMSLETRCKVDFRSNRFYGTEIVNQIGRTDIAKAFTAAPALDGVFTGQFYESMSELRDVTTMFVKLDSYCSIVNSDPISLQSFYHMVQVALDETGGFMRQFLIDDKGCVLIGMWGVPCFSHGNNGARSLRCASLIARGANKLSHRVSIGLTTGKVFCGNVGSMERHDYVGIGHTVNLAARLMSKAKGKILLDQTTYLQLPALYQNTLSLGDKLKLKGVDALVQSYVLQVLEPTKEMKQYSSLTGNTTTMYDEPISAAQEAAIIEDVAPSEVKKVSNEVMKAMFRLIERTDDIDRVQLIDNMGFTAPIVTEMNSRVPSNNNSFNRSSLGMSSRTGRPNRNMSTRLSFSVNARKAPSQKHIVSVLELLDGIKTKDGCNLRNVHCTILEGEGGTGKSTAAKYFVETSKLYVKKIAWVPLRLSDSTNKFGVFKAVFTQLVGAEKFTTEFEQKHCISTLLKEAYRNHDGYEVNSLKDHLILIDSALNLKWTWYDDLNISMSHVSGHDLALPSASLASPSFDGNLNDEVFSYLGAEEKALLHKSIFVNQLIGVLLTAVLVKEPSVIVVENAQYIDRLTWKVFKALLDKPVCAALLFTMRINSAKNDTRFDKDGVQLTPTRSASSPQVPSYSARSFAFAPNLKKNQVVPMQGVIEGNEFLSKPRNAPRRRQSMADALHSMYVSLLKHPNTSLVHTLNMSWNDVHAYLLVNLCIDSIPAAVVDAVYNISNGNWYYCQRIVKFIRERGAEDFIKEVSTSKARLHEMLSLFAVYGFDSLSSADKVVLKAGCVIGEQFQREMLEAVVPAAILANTEEILETLVSKGLILVVNHHPPCYAFTSAQFCHTLYDMIPRSETVQYHHKLALFIENHYAHELSEHYHSLSYHLGFCPDRLSAAFKYDILAADLSLSRSVYSDMIVFVRHAKEHARNLSEFRMLLKVIDCAAEDVLAVCNENNRHKSKGNENVRKPSFSLFSAPRFSFLVNEDMEDSVSVSISSTHVDSVRSMYSELEQMRVDVEIMIENCHAVKPTNSSSIDVSLYMPPPKLNWFPDYVEARDRARKTHSSIQKRNHSVLSKIRNLSI